MKTTRFFWGIFFIIIGIFAIFPLFFGAYNWFLGGIFILIGFVIFFNFSEDKIEEINWVKGGKGKR